MATPTIREVVAASTSASPATVNTGAGTAVGDVLVCFAGNDWNTAAVFGTPTGTAGTWTLQATGDRGTNNGHLKVWTRAVTVGGAQSVAVPTVGSAEEVFNTTFVLTGADTTTPADGTPAGSNAAASTSQVAPSVSPATADALLLCGVQCSPDGSVTYTPPSGMTERSDITDGSFAAQSTASLVLSASGATGTKTFTATAADAYASASIAIRGAGGAAAPPPRPPLVGPSQAAIRGSTW